jgi:predicted AAA+ superfamily ATPase
MIKRDFWVQRVQQAWDKATIVWLSGVRRAGKTTLTQFFEGALYLNCDLVRTKHRLSDPETFYESVTDHKIILDEIHQLDDPSMLLKIASDAYPHLKILATGSSTLLTTKKFKDTLTGRKRNLLLLPILPEELRSFGIKDLEKRLLHGGLPQALLAEPKDNEFYSEWIDSFFARDIQELFNIQKRREFILTLELLLRLNGGLLGIDTISKQIGISRPTVYNYINALELTHTVYILRPFHGRHSREIIKQPRIYAFDTGFVSYCRGWDSLHPRDCGKLLENLVLDVLLSRLDRKSIYFWRDKQKREIDFIYSKNNSICDAIEVKWNANAFEVENLTFFRSLYPRGKNIVVTSQAAPVYTQKLDNINVIFCPISEFGKFIETEISK